MALILKILLFILMAILIIAMGLFSILLIAIIVFISEVNKAPKSINILKEKDE